MVAAALVLGAAVLVAGVRDRRILVGALTFTVITNASNVVEYEFGAPAYVVPLALIVLAVTTLDRFVHAGQRPAARSLGGWLGAVLLVAAVSSALVGPFVSEHPDASRFTVDILMKDLVIVTAIALAVVDRSTMRAALAGLAVGGGVLASVTAAQALIGLQDHPMGGFGRWTIQHVAGVGESARAAGPFLDDPNSYAQHLVVAFGALLGLATSGSRPAARAFMVVAAGAIVVAVAATSSRTGLLAIAVVATIVVWSERPTRAQLAAAAAVAIAVLVPFGVVERLVTLGDLGSVGSSDVDASLRGRTSEALAALRMLGERPLTGVGYGAYPSEYVDVARAIGYETRFEQRSAHSLPLEIAAEQGLIGVAIWGAIAVFAVWSTTRLVRRHRAEGLGLGLALAGFAATAVFLHDVHPRVMWSLVALVLAAAAITDRPASGRPIAVDAHGEHPHAGRPVVAMVIQQYVPGLGGAERQLASLVPSLVAAGVRPVVITRDHPERPERDEVDGVPVVRLRTMGPKPIRSASFVVRARRELDVLRPDVVHAFDTLTPALVAIGHRRTHGTPVVVKILRSGALGDLDVLRHKWLGARRLRALVRDVDRFVAISDDIANELAEAGIGGDRIVRVPNGVDTERFRPSAQHEDSARPLRVVATGRLAPEKRLDQIVARWGRIRARHPTAELLIVGDGPERPKLEGGAGIRVLGRRDDVPELLRSADVYVSASIGEGLSNSLLEAMSSGLPCVVTDVGGVRDVIVDGVHGVIVDPDEVDVLVDHVGRLLDAPDQRRTLGRAARGRVLEGFSLPSTSDALVGIYRELARASSTTSLVGGACRAANGEAGAQTEASKSAEGRSEPPVVADRPQPITTGA